MKKLYLIGSLRNEAIPGIAKEIRQDTGWEVFDDWHAAGPHADDYWKEYELGRGHSYSEALDGYAAQHVFNFDRLHLDTCDAAVLALPAGRSGHLELGYVAGQGGWTGILLDQDYLEDGRFDVMYNFADLVTEDLKEIINALGVCEDASTMPRV